MFNRCQWIYSMLNKKIKSAVLGFTLTELMIALTLNTLLLAALASVFLANLDHYRKMLNMARLNQQLESSLDMMSNEIRRAGYWKNAYTDIGTHANNNPFMSAGTDITVNAANNCILFTYDRDGSGTLPSINAAIDDERYGFRLINQTLQARPPGAAFNCSATSTAWENMTDPTFVQITNLTFTLTTSTITIGPGTKGISVRDIAISITGRLTSDTSITKTLTQRIRIRNDKFIP